MPSTFAITCDGVADSGGAAPTYARPRGSMHACRSESKSSAPLDPGIPLAERRRHVVEPVSVAPVEARLEAPVPGTDLVGALTALAEPEIALQGTAREDDVGEFLDLFA